MARVEQTPDKSRLYPHDAILFRFPRNGRRGRVSCQQGRVLQPMRSAMLGCFRLIRHLRRNRRPSGERRPTRDEPWQDEFPPYSLSFLRYQETIAAGQPFPHLVRPHLPLPPEMEVVVCPGFVVADNPPGVVPGSVKRVRLPGTRLTPL